MKVILYANIRNYGEHGVDLDIVHYNTPIELTGKWYTHNYNEDVTLWFEAVCEYIEREYKRKRVFKYIPIYVWNLETSPKTEKCYIKESDISVKVIYENECEK